MGCRKGLGEAADRRQAGEIERRHLQLAAGHGARDRLGGRFPFAVSRTASTTCAPFPANTLAASNPSPLLAPVITAILPVWSGIFCSIQRS